MEELLFRDEGQRHIRTPLKTIQQVCFDRIKKENSIFTVGCEMLSMIVPKSGVGRYRTGNSIYFPATGLYFSSYMTHRIHSVQYGIERLVKDDAVRIRRRRIGLLAHPASVDHRYVHALELLRNAGAEIEILFGPEHGFTGEAQDMEPVAGRAIHPTGIPLKSLYGNTADTLAPSPDDLGGLDALLVDLQDVGARYYTFVWTALLALRACARAGIEMILTDRPNPLGGVAVEGPPQEDGYLSFVGLKKIAVRHGMTIGELIAMTAAQEGIAEILTVVEMKGWRRRLNLNDTDLPWVMTSPNMPTPDTALVYPGMCLIEGTILSEGRGTTRPFELIGGPGINGDRLAKKLSSDNLGGVIFRPAAFKPCFQKHEKTPCGGVQLHVVDRHAFQPYRAGVAMLIALKAEAGERFGWRHAPYEFVDAVPAIDLLTGSSTTRTMVDKGASLEEVTANFTEGENAFIRQREPFLFYA
jgi:uncharacterized protein YbbC (DUF1343 family)